MGAMGSERHLSLVSFLQTVSMVLENAKRGRESLFLTGLPLPDRNR